jgi:hypothetical protein
LKGLTCTGWKIIARKTYINRKRSGVSSIITSCLVASYVAVVGDIEENTKNCGDGSCCWEILYSSTDPGLVGCTFLVDNSTIGPLSCSTAVSTMNENKGGKLVECDAAFTQIVTGSLQTTRQWKVIELSGPTGGLPGIDAG